jgi:hypothetical protein
MYEESGSNQCGCERQRSDRNERGESESLPITMFVLAICALLVGGYALSITQNGGTNSASASVGYYDRTGGVDAVDRSGIEGRVIIRPISPPISPTVRPERANYRPYQATVSVMDQQGQTVTQFQSDPNGRFRLPLEPGRYTLRPESAGPLPRAAEQAVTVSEGQFTEVLIAYDSGIR